MRRWLLALLMTVSACTGAATTETTVPRTAPPEVSTTSATPSIVDGGLIEIDPATLVPIGSGDPILVGDWHEGVVSRNGRWAAIRTWDHVGEANSMSLVDLADGGTVVASVDEYAESPTVSDDGTIYYFAQTATPRLMRLGPDEAADVDADLPAGWFPLTDTLAVLSENRIGYLATPQGIGPASLVIVDGGVARTTKLDDVRAGSIETGSENGLAIVEVYTPDVTWDVTNGRAYVISAEEDVVVAVDLETGEVIENTWWSVTGFFDGWTLGIAVARAKGVSVGARREAYMTKDGGTLFVGTSNNEIADGADRWTATSSAENVLMIDTNTWQATVLDAQAWHLVPSPSGSLLIATGAEITTDSSGESTLTAGPVYVIETATGDVAHSFEATSGTIADAQWSSDSNLLYIESTGDQANIDIVDLTLDQAVGSVEFREMSLIGEAGLMAFHLDLD